MDLRSSVSALIAVTALFACSSPAPATVTQALADCNRGARSVEVHDSGVVRRVLGVRRSYSGSHEGFIVAMSRAGSYKVEDNVDITGPVPLRRGDIITLQGQLECNDDVIHWTHRDPSGRHQPGFIVVHGNTYR